MTYRIAAFAVLMLTGPAVAQQPSGQMPGIGANPTLPQPHQTPSTAKFSSIIGWPEGRTPTTPPGFRVPGNKRQGMIASGSVGRECESNHAAP